MSPRQQADASQVLKHYREAFGGAAPDLGEASVNVLLAAGAKSEVLHALHLRRQLDPVDPYADAVAIEVGCWDPSTRMEARLDADDWLEQYPDHLLSEYVKVRHEWLNGELIHMEDVVMKEAYAQTFPFIAFSVAAFVCGAIVKRLLRS